MTDIAEPKTLKKTLLLPYADRVLVEEVGEEERKRGHIYLPDTMKMDRKYRLGKVVAIGGGRFLDQNESRQPFDGLRWGENLEGHLAEGDVILYHKDRFMEYFHDDEDGSTKVYHIVSESDFLMVIREVDQV